MSQMLLLLVLTLASLAQYNDLSTADHLLRAILDRRDALRYGTGQKPPWFVDLCGRWRAL